MAEAPAAHVMGDMFQGLVREQGHQQRVQGPLQVRVARRPGQGAVKLEVKRGRFQQVAVPGFHIGHDAFQLLQDLRGHVGAGQAHRLAFQQQAQAEHVLHLLRTRLGDEHAAAFAVLHQPLLLQLGQRLAHRDAADVQLACDLAFVQPVAGAVLAGQDALTERLQHLCTQVG